MKRNEYSVTMQLSHLLASEIGMNGDKAIVIDSIYNTKEEITDENIHEIIEKLFHINIDMGRVSQTIISLLKENILYRSDKALLISPETLEEINDGIAKNSQCEKEALKEWFTQYQEYCNQEFSEVDEDRFNHCILTFIRRFFLSHGADCYKLISGEKQSDYFDLTALATACRNDIDEPLAERLIAFLANLFSQELTSSQTSFLILQLKKAINYLSNVIDIQTRDSLYSQMNDLVIYLDTTILYRLLNLQGDKRYEATKKLIEFCKEAKIKLKVFQATFEEISRRIQYDASVITKHPTPVSFAAIGYQCRTSENYISTFWNEQRKTGISATDFNFRYSNLQLLLDEWGIIIDEVDYISDCNLLQIKDDLCSIIPKFGGSDLNHQKNLNAIEHDAICIASVCYLQKKNVLTAIESETIFLTSDWSLIRLQRNDIEYRNHVDFAVLPSQLMQILCITSPVTGYFETFMGLFSSSRSYFGSSSLSNEHIQEIMGRVASYKCSTPAFAEKVLTNQLIKKTFSEKETEEEQNALVDEAILAEVEVMEATIAQNEKELSAKSKDIEQVRNENLDKEGQIENLNKRLATLEKMRDESEETLSIYEQNFRRNAERKSRTKAISRIATGYPSLIIGIFMLATCLFSLIPPLAQIVTPIIGWLKSSSVFSGETESLNTVIVTLVTLGGILTTYGVSSVKPGYNKLKKKYVEREYENLPNS